jgi:multidrug efflux pump
MIVIAGYVSMVSLPVEQYPNLTPPTICVTAIYPGATAETISETVQSTLEETINGVEDMIYMNSIASNNGTATTTVFFNVGADPDKAMINVNNRVQMAIATLPEEVRRYGITVTKKSSSILQVVTLYSEDERYDSTYLGNYGMLNIVDELKRLEGVGDVTVLGGSYSMRIWLKPDKLAKLNITTNDIALAIREQNSQHAAGAIGKTPTNIRIDRSYMIVAQGRYSEVSQFENIILRANQDGTTLLLKDVADIELGAQSYDVMSKTRGCDCVPIMISLSPGANSISTAEIVTKKLAELSEAYPSGIKHKVVFETTGFVKNSIKEVIKTLVEAIVLVFLVIMLFLKNFRATFIPCLAVPVSIIGAFAGMLFLGFSINTLTLFGLVLAIGIVVDDAIVVIENVERIMRTEGLPIREATIKAMEEVSGALVAIVLVLAAVFIPVAFIGGLAGVMYKQFAITIVISVTISGFCALTLTPALCVVFLGNHSTSSSRLETNKFFICFDSIFEKITNGYVKLVGFFLRNVKTGLFLITVIAGISTWLFRITPSSLVPNEDQGMIICCSVLDPAASLSRSHRLMESVNNAFHKDKNIEDSAFVVGYNMLNGSVSTNAATMFARLSDWSKRPGVENSAQTMAKKAFGIGMGITDGMVIGICPPPIVGMSTTGGFEAYIQRVGDTNSSELEAKVREFIVEASKRPELTGLISTFNASTPQLKMEVDNLKALSLGVSISEIYSTMAATFGASYINDFSKSGRGFKVMMQSREDYRSYPDKIGEIYVRSKNGNMIPLSSFVKLTPTVGPDTVERFNVMPAAKIMGSPSFGYTSGEAMKAVEEVSKKVLGTDYLLSWAGSSFQEKISGGVAYYAIILGLVMVFLILAAQYERWSLPFVVISGIPFGLFGAVLSVILRGFSNDIYFQIALITLMGLSAKNAILIVEFAVILRHEGESLINAALKAARLRFRPIVMTSLAFILGCLPLAMSSGAGSASRNSLGTGVVGGMIAATVFVPLFIPLMYVLITKISERRTSKRKEAHV